MFLNDLIFKEEKYNMFSEEENDEFEDNKLNPDEVEGADPFEVADGVETDDTEVETEPVSPDAADELDKAGQDGSVGQAVAGDIKAESVQMVSLFNEYYNECAMICANYEMKALCESNEYLFQEAGEGFFEKIKQGITWLIDKFNSLWEKFKAFMKNFFDGVVSFFKRVSRNALNKIKSISKDVWMSAWYKEKKTTNSEGVSTRTRTAEVITSNGKSYSGGSQDIYDYDKNLDTRLNPEGKKKVNAKKADQMIKTSRQKVEELNKAEKEKLEKNPLNKQSVLEDKYTDENFLKETLDEYGMAKLSKLADDFDKKYLAIYDEILKLMSDPGKSKKDYYNRLKKTDSNSLTGDTAVAKNRISYSKNSVAEEDREKYKALVERADNAYDEFIQMRKEIIDKYSVFHMRKEWDGPRFEKLMSFFDKVKSSAIWKFLTSVYNSVKNFLKSIWNFFMKKSDMNPGILRVGAAKTVSVAGSVWSKIASGISWLFGFVKRFYYRHIDTDYDSRSKEDRKVADKAKAALEY